MRVPFNDPRRSLVVLPGHLAAETPDAGVRLRNARFKGRHKGAMIFDSGHRLIDRLPSSAHVRPIEWHLKPGNPPA